MYIYILSKRQEYKYSKKESPKNPRRKSKGFNLKVVFRFKIQPFPFFFFNEKRNFLVFFSNILVT